MSEINRSQLLQSLPRVTSGFQVSSLYRTVRSKAFTYANAKNRCHSLAYAAYSRGSYEAARKFTKLGHEYHERMVDAHRQAAEEIFVSRNRSKFCRDIVKSPNETGANTSWDAFIGTGTACCSIASIRTNDQSCEKECETA